MRGPVDGHVDAAGLEVAGTQDGRQRGAERAGECVYQSHCVDLLPREVASVGMPSAHGSMRVSGILLPFEPCVIRNPSKPLKSLGAKVT